MKMNIEQLPYQKQAINSVVKVFEGQEKNNFENSYLFDIYSNQCNLTDVQIIENIKAVLSENGLSEEISNLSETRDLTVEMETGTGKTLVYIRTIYELFLKYGFTKFIILVPSIAVKEGVLNTLNTFQDQLSELYGFNIDYFEYDSKWLSKLKNFIGYNDPQIMVTTMQSFSTDERILNQEMRDDSIQGLSYLEALGKTNPIVMMDEPQEGMDTENSINRLKTLNPLFKIRYSATHKVVKNMIYRLTPNDAYKQGLVKKIEVLSVAEKNDEASFKIELSEVTTTQTGSPRAKLFLWKKQADKFAWKSTGQLKVGDNLGDKSNNISYNDFTIKQIYKSLEDGKYRVIFTNEVEVVEKKKASDISGIFREQLKWLIQTHYKKRAMLTEKGIKCLSLIFIDKVDNYMSDNGLIKKLFEDELKKYFENNGKHITDHEVEAVQGYYFAKTQKGDFTDNTNSMKKNSEIYNLILKNKQQLLSLDNDVEFIFTHSALGVGWDNPNVFNIATLNQSYSENKKRQEIGRGLRICVNQEGQRIYDNPEVNEGEEINLLTIIPNETYETFAEQYQQQIEDVYGHKDLGSELRKNVKGNKAQKIVRRNENVYSSNTFRDFFRNLSQKTSYKVHFNENSIIENAIDKLNNIIIPRYSAEVVLNKVQSVSEQQLEAEELGRTSSELKADFTSIDIIKEISKETNLSFNTVLSIFKEINNYENVIKNPPLFIKEASNQLKQLVLDEMVRTIEYRNTEETFNLEQFQKEFKTFQKTADTPNRGLYDKVIYDSDVERNFALDVDSDTQVVCFVKFPDFYKIPTPIGSYNPDWGVVLRFNQLDENSEQDLYFVVETKGTNDINDKKTITEAEKYKIECAKKHFESLGINAQIRYEAPIKEFRSDFKDKINQGR